MVKDLSLNITYKDKTELISCQPHEFQEKVTKCFSINLKDVELYRVNKDEYIKITAYQIADLMKIMIVDKKATDVQRTLRSYFEKEKNNLSQSAVENIIAKLRNNTALTGNERKSLIDWLQEYPPFAQSKKRKLNENGLTETEKKSRKIQVNLTLINKKDFCCQTNINVIPRQRLQTVEEDINTKIKKLATVENPDKDEVAVLMATSFDDRRNFIVLKKPPVSVIRDKYPLLFEYEEVKNELERIYYPGKCAEFLKNMESYAVHILHNCSATDQILLRTIKRVDLAPTDLQKKYARTVGSVFSLATQLEEDFSFIHLSDIPHVSADIYPYIDASVHAQKEVYRDNILFRIIVEGVQLCEAPTFPEAVLCLMAAFFIFDIDYPEKCQRTLIAFEKLYLCANDTTDIDEMTSQMIKMIQLNAKATENETLIK